MNCSKPERPIRALWPAAVALAIMFLASFFAMWPANQSACNLLFYFLSGLALYLLMQRGIRHKIYAAGILLWATLLNTYITAISRIMQIWQSLKKKSIEKGKEVCKHFTNGGTTVRKSPGVVV